MRKEDVKVNMDTLFALTGRTWPSPGCQKVYLAKLQKYDLQDLVAACSSDDALEEISRFGFNWPVLKKHIEMAKNYRVSHKEAPGPREGEVRFQMTDKMKALTKKVNL